MTDSRPVRRAFIGFNWRLLLAARLVIVVAAVVATLLVLRFWPDPFTPPHIYAIADLVLSCVAVSRLRRAGWIFVGIHLLVAILWCELAWNLPQSWFG
ncbi:MULTISPECIES: hypothetical protein [Phenylobacterium]|uniref:Abi (CAAX) family protease n=1 Tax=Phenylobacterium koreense TaxID=266125 RepID=A0ABV2EEU5_9CAUL